jgi:hypothetical protein
VVRERFSYHHVRITTGAELRATLRAGAYAWPGGYPLFFVTDDGCALSFASVRANLRQCIRSIREGWRGDGWRIVGCEINYEDPNLRCEHSGELIGSAYA